MKKFISFIIMLFMCITVCFVSSDIVSAEHNLPRLVDDADLLGEYEEEELIEKLDEISLRQNFDVVVVTVDSLGGKRPMAYADDFYDYNGYGMGVNNDGVLLLISMEERDWWISTCGYGIKALTDAGIDYISDKFLSDLSSGDYADAFTTFAILCDEFVTQAKTGRPYDVGNMPKEPYSFLLSLFVSVIIGGVVGFITVTVMKGQLKSVRFQTNSSQYMKRESLRMTRQHDHFLYSRVSKERKPEPSESSGGGSSTHTSSSGSTHGGGGGKF